MLCSLPMPLLKVVLFCLAIQGVAGAQDRYEKMQGGPYSPTALELKMLPPACTARVQFQNSDGRIDTPEVKQWSDILGDAFIHIHHYCFGLNFLNRIDRGVGDKEYLLGLALGDFQYMQRMIPADNVLRPDVEFNIGQVLYRMNNIPEAIAQFRKAILLRPKFERAYLLISFCFKRLGDRASAVAALELGLAKVPESRALGEALADLNSVKK